MVFLLVYAIAIWAAAVIYRRRWQSFAAITLGMAPIALATHLIVQWNIEHAARGAAAAQTAPGPAPTWLYIVGAAYGGLIFGVGLLIAVQPRKRYAEEPCPICEYEVQGIEGNCPECGHDLALAANHFRKSPKPVTVPPPDVDTTEAARRHLRDALEDRARERAEQDARDRGLTPPARASLDPSA